MQKLFTDLLPIAVAAMLLSEAQALDSLGLDSKGYIRDWLMLAPISLPEGRSGEELILQDQVRNEAALKPKAGDTVQVRGKELTWRHVTAATNYFDFNALLKAEGGRAAGYVVTYIECEKDLPEVTMAVGTNDEGRIYLNGEDIYAFTEPRTLELDSEKGKVGLKKGVNVVVFKIINEQGNWQGAMRLLDKSGAPLKNVRIKLAP